TATAALAQCNPLTYLGSYLDACADAGGRPPSGPALARFFPWAAGEADLSVWGLPSPGPAPSSTSHRYCARDFSAADLEVVRRLTTTLPHRSAIAAGLCAELGWRRLDGRPKEMSARVALLRMERDGLITLPPPRNPNGNGHILRYAKPDLKWIKPAPPSLPALGRIELVVVDTPAASRRWRGLIAS
ncbi:hypothetical protein B1B_19535, partial [mine drainage metagenome]